MRNAVIWAVICMSLGWTALAQQRMIPHVTRLDGGFEAQVVIANLGSTDQRCKLIAWTRLGVFYDEYESTLKVGDTLFMNLDELFTMPEGLPDDASDVSHITIDADQRVTVNITYKATGDGNGPAHVKENDVQTLRWRIYAGDPGVTWDGMAVVNMSDDTTPLTVFAYDAEGNQVGFISPFYPLDPKEKELYLLTDIFADARAPAAWYEVLGAAPLAVTGLRGRRDNAFLWENEALPMEGPPTEN